MLHKLRRHPRLARLLLLLAATVLPLLLIEGLLRGGNTRPDENVDSQQAERWLKAEKSAELGWIFPADTTGIYRSSGRRTNLTTNGWGLRGPEVSSDSLTQRILVLGDSYAFGWGVDDEDGFVRLLEREIRGMDPGASIEFINGGIPGYAPYQQNRMLAYVGQRTSYAAVVATLSLANDMVDELRIRRYAPDRLDRFSYELRDPGSIAARLIGASRLLTLIDERTNHVQFAALNARTRCVSLADESMTQLAATCRANDTPLIWVVVPRKQEISPAGLGSWVLSRATDRVRRHFLDLASRLEVPALDLKPTLLAVQEHEEVYLPGDAHWNEAGHRAVARDILPLLLEVWPPTD